MCRPSLRSILGILIMAGMAAAAAACGPSVAPQASTPGTPTAAPTRQAETAQPKATAIPVTPTVATATRPATPIPTPTVAAAPSPSTLPTSAPTVSASTGYLEGTVTIGPLTPVQRVGQPNPTPSPEVCTSRGLTVYQADGKTVVTSFSFQPDCGYRVALSPGSYVVDLKDKPAIGGSKTLPRTVAIQAGATTRLDVDIDTGIR